MDVSGKASWQAQIDQAWWLIYLDARKAGDIAQQLLAAAGDELPTDLRGEANFHVAFSRMRSGRFDEALAANAAARQAFTLTGNRRGLLLCDEAEALHLRATGKLDEAMRLHQAIAADRSVQRPAIDRYIHHNSFGLTYKRLGQTDESLQSLYKSLEAAKAVESPGPQIGALCNLGGAHSDLFNHVDGEVLSAQAMDMAEQNEAWVVHAISGVNLIQIYDALDKSEECLRVVQRLLHHEPHYPAGMLVRPLIALGFWRGGNLAAAQQWLDLGANAAFADGDGHTEWARVQAGVHLARGEAAAARDVAHKRVTQCAEQDIKEQPYTLLKLLQVASDACEACGDASSALRHLRQSQALYESMVGRSARARVMALRAEEDLAQAQRERDMAHAAHEVAERDRRQLIDLNAALKQKMEEAQALQAQLREQAIRDPLTGLHNRRYLYEVAPSWLELARRRNAPATLALLDLDRFKHLNDTFGHECGDSVLKQFASVLTRRFRSSDLIFRYGGEEFVVLAPDAEAADLLDVFGQLNAECSSTIVPSTSGPVNGFTFSAGLAEWGPGESSLRDLLLRADARLYRAKAQGRARCCLVDA